MKNLFIILISLLVMSSCTTTKEAHSSKLELRKEKKLTEQWLVKNAVESRRYIIKLDRIYFSYGGITDLIPRANFIIIDGEKAIISTAYLGRQYDIKPIAGINIRGRAEDYAVTNNLSKGSYQINMKVKNGGANSFVLYLTISKNGFCNASVSSLKIDNITYSGYLVPLIDKTKPSLQKGDMI
jgi:Domain of unknown function (DUF4251)